MMTLKHVALVMAMASAVACYCPYEKIHSTGNCSYRIHCHGHINGVRLANHCMGASNDPVIVDLTLTDAVERLGDNIDKGFLSIITTLRISGNWPQTKLSLLRYTTRLENLFLIGNHIENISGNPFLYLNSLDVLDLSHNKLTEINHLFQFELQPSKLRILHLEDNKIVNITALAFAELISLIELDLSYNLISDLTIEPFSNLTSLEILRLNHNNIINLNGAVNNLYELKHLYLKGNQIENIDEKSLDIIKHLETFDVSSNHLENISSVMFSRHWKHLDNHAVCKIILSGNYITSVPNGTAKAITTRFVRHLKRSVGDSVVFTELDLSNNNISNIEYNAFQSLIQLTTLNLSNNKMITFLVNSDDIVYVKFLNLSGNHITSLYLNSFSGMKSLQNLDLSHNSLDTIPDQTFMNNRNLRHVNMTHNAMDTLDNLNINMFHIDGGILDLSNNGLSKLRIPRGDGLRLKYLILRDNLITDPSLIDLWHVADLKTLDMGVNHIRELHENSLRLPDSLTTLDLSCNEIEIIAPSTFLRIWRLKTLRLSHNMIQTIEYGTFRGLSTLINLDLSSNKISSLDSKLMMDLKSLSSLSLDYNRITKINDEGWFGHKYNLKVYLDGNNITCEWLAVALKNYYNGYTKMQPTVLQGKISGHTVEGIPCTPEKSQRLMLDKLDHSMVAADERLLLITQKILEAVQDQTYYLKKYVWMSIQEDGGKVKSLS